MPINGMTILFAGSGEFGAATLTRLIDAEAAIVRVYTQPDRPAGRGKKLTPTPIAQLADARGVNVVRTSDINAESLPPADVMVVIAFGQKIAPHVIDHPKFGSINLHASLLPKYRGAAPIHWAIVNGEAITGNSVIRLANKMDAGAVLGQSQVNIGQTETTGELHERLAQDGAPLVERVLTELRDGNAIETEQDHSLATIAPKLSREKSVIDWSRDAGSISSLVRGLSPWPGCRVRVMDGENEIARVTLVRTKTSPAEPDPTLQQSTWGTIDAHGSVRCAGGAVTVLELQPEGKRSMSLDAYRNGRSWHAGLRLESIA